MRQAFCLNAIKPVLMKRFSVCALCAICSFASGNASSAKLTTLHAFENCNAGTCTDGSGPLGNLVQDSLGNLFGTASEGGTNGLGSVFELSPDGQGGWSYQTIYNFCSEEDCADGANPQSTLIVDAAGGLYGTTHSGGEEGGVAFRLSPKMGRTSWQLVVIHNYCGADAPNPEDDCKGGSTPSGGLTYVGAAAGVPYDGVSPLYGSSLEGGEGEAGMVYQLKPPKNIAKEEWPVRELYIFCAPPGPHLSKNSHSHAGKPPEGENCDDGKMPSGGLVADASGRLYGATNYGGEDANLAGGGGVVFELSRGPHNVWDETVLHKFCQRAGCSDGQNPYGALAIDGNGNLLGATLRGGKRCGSRDPCGVAFRITPDDENSSFTVLHNFCASPKCTDGAGPQGEFVVNPAGNVSGAALLGGANKGGSVFSLQGKSLTTLYSFCAQPKCADGQYPLGVVGDSSGNLFGVTTTGGANGGGSVFELTP